MKKSAVVIEKKIDHIVDLWKVVVEKEIPGLSETEPLLLLNVLPQLLKNFALVLARSNSENLYAVPEEFQEIISDSLSHGRHRATTANFSAKNIIREHKLLHRAIIMVLKSEGAYDEEVGITLSLLIESSMEYSIDAYNKSLQDMREKLIAFLAHDIRNPLAAANMGLRSLEYNNGEDRFNKVREMTTRNLRRTMALVENLLDAVTVKPGEGISMHFTSCNFVEEVKLVFSEACQFHNREFRWFCDRDVIKGVFDPTAIRRITENLMTNAVKYGDPDEPITVSIDQEKENVVLKVHNGGNSISPEDRKDIFDFLKCKEGDRDVALKSWGIGLSFVKMAAEAHGGHVKLESDEEKGTTFLVIFSRDANEPGKKRAVLNFEKD